MILSVQLPRKSWTATLRGAYSTPIHSTHNRYSSEFYTLLIARTRKIGATLQAYSETSLRCSMLQSKLYSSCVT